MIRCLPSSLLNFLSLSQKQITLDSSSLPPPPSGLRSWISSQFSSESCFTPLEAIFVISLYAMHLHIRTLLFMIISLFPECVLIMHACMINLLWSIYVLNLYHFFSKFYVYRVWILSFMSYHQSRFDKTEQTQYRRTGRSGPRYSGRTKGGGPGGGNAHPPSNRRYISVYELFQYLVLWFVEILHDDMCFIGGFVSFKKNNNVQGGQYRVSNRSVGSNYASAAGSTSAVQNGAQPQMLSSGIHW